MDSGTLYKDVLERRKQGFCAVDKLQKEVTNGEKGELVTIKSYYVSHQNDRTDRDVCTDCGNKLLNGGFSRILPNIRR